MTTSAKGKLITVAIHTYERATILKALLEKEGIETIIHNVNLSEPVISSGVRVRIYEKDLPLALKIIEQSPILNSDLGTQKKTVVAVPANILIPIDFSEYTYKACKIGFNFAKRLGGKVTLLHSYVSMNFSGSLPFNSDGYNSEIANIEDNRELEKITRDKMNTFAKRIKEEIENGNLPEVEFKSNITEGVPEDSILDVAKQIKATLIVMGTRGKDKKEIELIGSVTAEVLDAGKYPVFTIPEDISIDRVDDIKNVVFFSNLCQEDLISFDIFIRLFNGKPLNVTLIPIIEKKISNIDLRINATLEYFKEHYSECVFSIKNFSDTKFINEFEKYVVQDGIDLIIIPNKKRNIFARLFNPSIAHRMLFHTDTPMLVVPYS